MYHHSFVKSIVDRFEDFTTGQQATPTSAADLYRPMAWYCFFLTSYGSQIPSAI